MVCNQRVRVAGKTIATRTRRPAPRLVWQVTLKVHLLLLAPFHLSRRYPCVLPNRDAHEMQTLGDGMRYDKAN